MIENIHRYVLIGTLLQAISYTYTCVALLPASHGYKNVIMKITLKAPCRKNHKNNAKDITETNHISNHVINKYQIA